MASLLSTPRTPVLSLPVRRRDELSTDALAECTEAFRLFDTAGSGSIGYLELKCCIRALDFNPSREELLALVREFDRESSGRISREAFIEIMARLHTDRDPEEALVKAFELFTESGFIHRRDLKRVCREMGENVSEEEIQVMIDEFDTDGDGQIHLADFRAVLSEAMLSGAG